MVIFLWKSNYSTEVWTNETGLKADIAKRYPDSSLSYTADCIRVVSPSLGNVGEIVALYAHGTPLAVEKEARFIQSVPPDSVGQDFNNDPACFARYVAMQAKLALNAGAVDACREMLECLSSVLNRVEGGKK